MKTIKFYTFIAVLAFAMTSCVENSNKYKAAVAQRDSLALLKQSADSGYNQSLVLLNDIEAGFAAINQNEKEMKVNLKGVENNTTNKREIIAAQMTAIKEGIEKNKAKIAELRNLASKRGKANIKLTETVKRLQAEMDEKIVQIQFFQTELAKKNIVITELNTTVNSQQKDIAVQQNVMDQQKSKIKGQDMDMNTVWYCVATSKQLRDAKIVSNGGLFQSKKLLDNEFDKNAFIKVDLRSISSIVTNSRNVKILSSHPQSSYTLIMDADKKISIKITDSPAFWSVSKYLVVQI